jgi:hypothetical protein
MRTISNLIGFLFGILLGALLFLAILPSRSQDSDTLPREAPATATGFVVCKPGQKTQRVVAIVFTYPSGRMIRVDWEHLYGFKDANEMYKYAMAAPDQAVYTVGCGEVST